MLSFVILKNLSAITNLAKVPGDQIVLFCNSQLQSLQGQSGSKYLRKLPHHLISSLKLLLKGLAAALATKKSLLGKAPPIYQLSY